MDQSFWYKQTEQKPLFSDMLWNRPENRQYAGKLLIIGGNKQGFSAPATAYSESLKAGVGVARVLMPDALSRTVGKLFPEAEFAPSTPIGSFATQSLGEIMPAAEWADGVLIAGDIGKNSETTILLDQFLEKFSGSVTLAGDTVGYAITQAAHILRRPNTTIVCSFQELQKLLIHANYPIALTSTLGIMQFVDFLHAVTEDYSAQLVISRDDTVFVAVEQKISSTPKPYDATKIAAHAAVWWLQNPAKPFEALSTSLVA